MRPGGSDIGALEAELEAAPDDIERRLKLYFALVLAHQGDVSKPEVFLPHVLVFVRRAPFLMASRSAGIVSTDDSRHVLLRDAWASTLLEHDDAFTLLNGIDFYSEFDWIKARQLGERLGEVAPDDSDAKLKRAGLELEACDRGEPGASYERVLDVLLGELDPSTGRLRAPHGAAIAAYEAGQPDVARECAEQALAWPSYGVQDIEHCGATVMGLLALDANDVATATTWLKRAADCRLSRSGPSLRLARAFARRGDRAQVRGYLDHVGERWRGPPHALGEWLKALDDGRLDDLRNPGR
jgi:Tfp pilus assembly protein PilF